MTKRPILNPLFLALSIVVSAPTLAAAWCTNTDPGSLGQLRNEVNKQLLPQSRAIERVHTEGTLPHQGIRDQSLEAKKDWPLMRDLALLWQKQHQPGDLAALSRLLNDWGTRYKPSFNPVDETGLDAYIDAYAMTREDLPPPVRAVAQRFVRELGEGYLNQMEHNFKPGDGRWINNWNSHRVKLATLSAVALEDPAMFARARAQFIEQLGRNLRPGGSTVDVEQRDALHYVVYDLEPLTRAAVAARLRGQNWLVFKGASDASLENALDWLAPYAKGDKTHEEFVHSHVKFDDQRREAGESGFSGLWNPQSATGLYAMATLLNPKYAAVSERLHPMGGWMAACWGR